MSLPKNGGKVLGSASNGGHGESLLLLVVGIIEVVFALSEIDDLDLVIRHEEKVGWLYISMTDALALQERTSRNQTAVHVD